MNNRELEARAEFIKRLSLEPQLKEQAIKESEALLLAHGLENLTMENGSG